MWAWLKSLYADPATRWAHIVWSFGVVLAILIGATLFFSVVP